MVEPLAPLISIVIPTFNSMSENKRIDYLLDSIFDQTYKNFEIIVIDNFSKDATREICKKYPVRFIQTKSTISMAWNLGIERSKGQYILFLDSDMSIPRSFLKECVDRITCESADCIKFDFSYMESRKGSCINVVDSRNLEVRMGAAPLNIYFYSTRLIGATRYPGGTKPIVGEEYIFRSEILTKKPKIAKISVTALHYYDPSFLWLARRSIKYGKWFLETKKHLSGGKILEFIHYNSVIRREALFTFFKAAKNRPSLILSFPLYLGVKYTSFALGYLVHLVA